MGVCKSSNQKSYEIVTTLMPYKVHIMAKIKQNEQTKFFDFQSSSYPVKEIEVDFSAQLATVDNELVALTKNEWVRNAIEIANITLNEQQAFINSISQQQDHNLWIALKSDTNQIQSIDYWDFKIGDIIKFGRVRMQLLEYTFLTPCDKANQYQDNQEEDIQTISDVASCRICFSSQASKINPLISPCKCEGSVKYTHQQCLQSWIKNQLKIREQEHLIQYLCKRLDCEICKFTFKNIYSVQDKSYSILKLQKPKSSYITFKVTSDDTSKEALINVVEIGEKTELKIGRIPDCDIKLRDISVSRSHATLKLIPTNKHTLDNPDYTIRVQDCNSKSGTLVLAQDRDLLIIPEDGKSPISVYTGRVLLQFVQKNKINQSPAYKHPDNVVISQIETKPQQNQQEQIRDSFVTHDKPTAGDIIIKNSQNPQIAQPNMDIEENNICDERFIQNVVVIH